LNCCVFSGKNFNPFDCDKAQAQGIALSDGTRFLVRGFNPPPENCPYPVCDVANIEEDEYDELKEKLFAEIEISNTDEIEQEEILPQETISLANKVSELEAKLNKLLNAE